MSIAIWLRAMDPGDVISYWLTIDEVAEEYFK